MRPFLRTLKALPPATFARLLLAVAVVILAVILIFDKNPWSSQLIPGRKIKLSHYVALYFWIAAAINLAAVFLLAATAGWWARPLGKSPAAPSRTATPRWFWPLVATAMLMTAAFSWPRLGQSVWHDEANRVKNTIAGEFRQSDDGTLDYHPVEWRSAFFDYRLPNHVGQSVLSKAFNDAWLAVARPAGLQFSETAIRLPGYLAGILGIAAIALLFREVGFPSAGVIAAFFLALHPWYIRYTSEARGYVFVLALLPLTLMFFCRGVQTGRWRWWLACAAAQFGMAYFYATAVYVLLVINLIAPAAILIIHGRTNPAVTILLRWFVSGVFAAMVLLQLLLPCIPQFLKYVSTTNNGGDLGFVWTQNFLTHLLAGIPWSYTFDPDSTYIELFPWFLARPGLGVLIVAFAVSLLALGIRRFVAAGPLTGLLVLPLLLPAVLCYVETKMRAGQIHEWYLIFILPGIVGLAAVGLDEILAGARPGPARTAAAAFIAFVLGAYAVWTAPQRNFLMTRAIEPFRESVLVTRPSLDPHDPRQREILTASFCGPPGPYDPHLIRFQTPQDLAALTRQADREGRDLYVNLGFLTTVTAEHEHKYNLLKNSGLFEETAFIQGYHPTLSRHIFKYKPGTQAGFDFASVPVDKGEKRDDG